MSARTFLLTSRTDSPAPSNPVLVAFREYVVDPYDHGLAWCAALWVEAIEGRLRDAYAVGELFRGLHANEEQTRHAVAVLSRIDRVDRVRDPLHFHGEVSSAQRIELNRAYRAWQTAHNAAPRSEGLAAASAAIGSLLRYAGISAE